MPSSGEYASNKIASVDVFGYPPFIKYNDAYIKNRNIDVTQLTTQLAPWLAAPSTLQCFAKCKDNPGNGECDGYRFDQTDDGIFGTALCVSETICMNICQLLPECVGIDVHQSVNRCFLNDRAQYAVPIRSDLTPVEYATFSDAEYHFFLRQDVSITSQCSLGDTVTVSGASSNAFNGNYVQSETDALIFTQLTEHNVQKTFAWNGCFWNFDGYFAVGSRFHGSRLVESMDSACLDGDKRMVRTSDFDDLRVCRWKDPTSGLSWMSRISPFVISQQCASSEDAQYIDVANRHCEANNIAVNTLETALQAVSCSNICQMDNIEISSISMGNQKIVDNDHYSISVDNAGDHRVIVSLDHSENVKSLLDVDN